MSKIKLIFVDFLEDILYSVCVSFSLVILHNITKHENIKISPFIHEKSKPQ